MTTTTTPKIESLTPEQEALLPVWRDKWIAIGQSTDDTDFEKAKAAAILAYQAADLEPPEKWVLLDSPLAGCRAAAYWSLYPDTDPALFTNEFLAQVADEHIKQLGLYCEDAVRKNRTVPFDPAVKAELSSALSGACWGAHHAGWLSVYDYFWRVVHLESCAKLNGLIELAKECGWWYPYRDFCVLTKRPCEQHFDDQHRLHNEKGYALRYRDGYGIPVINGVRVPRLLITDPSTNTLQAIETETNAEVRRIRIRLYGLQRFLTDAKLELVQQDDFGRLYKRQFADNEPAVAMVRFVNSTPEPSPPKGAPVDPADGTEFGEYVYRASGRRWYKLYFVPCRSTCMTAHEAAAASFDMTVEEYRPTFES